MNSEIEKATSLLYLVIIKKKETGADVASVNKIIKTILNVIEVIIDNASLDLNEHNEKVLKVNDVLTIIAHKAYS